MLLWAIEIVAAFLRNNKRIDFNCAPITSIANIKHVPTTSQTARLNKVNVTGGKCYLAGLKMDEVDHNYILHHINNTINC